MSTQLQQRASKILLPSKASSAPPRAATHRQFQRRPSPSSRLRHQRQHTVHHLLHKLLPINPPFIQTRMTGGADFDSAVYNATTGLFSYANVVPAGANQCINGDCPLPGETNILNGGYQSSVSIFIVDYDASLRCHSSPDMRSLLMPLVQYANSSNIVGGLNGTTGVYGNSTSGGSASPTMSAMPSTSTLAFTSAAGLLETRGALMAFASFVVCAMCV